MAVSYEVLPYLSFVVVNRDFCMLSSMVCLPVKGHLFLLLLVSSSLVSLLARLLYNMTSPGHSMLTLLSRVLGGDWVSVRIIIPYNIDSSEDQHITGT